MELKVIQELVKICTVHFESELLDLDSTDGILYTISYLVQSVQEEFEHLIGADSDKKIFIRSLTKLILIFTGEK